MERRDYIMDQIEKIAQLIAALMGKKQIDLKKIEQALADTTGLDPSLFKGANKEALMAIVKLLDDDNKKLLIAELLLAKDAKLYEQTYRNIMSQIDSKKLHPKIKALFNHR